MAAEDVEGRLVALEQRLANVERQLAPQFGSPRQPGQPARPTSPPPQATDRARSPSQALAGPAAATTAPVQPVAGAPRSRAAAGAPASHQNDTSLVTSVLGWGGAVAFVLAAAYLVRLGIDSGWLTPQVQIAAAVVAGFLLIGAGFGLRGAGGNYAGYLPACGIVILFLAIYSAQLFYRLVDAQVAVLALASVCVLSLWLCRVFRSGLYAVFAVAGSYSAPLLLAGAHASITDLVIYFSAWSVVFSVYAVWYGRRSIYLLAAYMALIVFDAVWHAQASAEWLPALAFQAVQFGIFGVATAVFSARRREPLDTTTALAHLPLLLLFYALQYHVLGRHLPALAPWISVASLAAVALLYLATRAVLRRPLPGGELLLWCYLALVLFHAGYLEAWPGAWAPWASFIVVPVAWLVTLQRKDGVGPLWALWAAAGAIFVLNYVRVVTNFALGAVPGHALLAIAYAILLYAGYALVSGREGLREVKMLLVYAGHASAMAAAVQLLDVAIVQSIAWGLLALACLAISMWRQHRMLGQSSLLVFGATAGKVLLYDLSDAQPLVRIVSLVVLGATFYVGGMLYQRMSASRAAS